MLSVGAYNKVGESLRSRHFTFRLPSDPGWHALYMCGDSEFNQIPMEFVDPAILARNSTLIRKPARILALSGKITHLALSKTALSVTHEGQVIQNGQTFVKEGDFLAAV